MEGFQFFYTGSWFDEYWFKSNDLKTRTFPFLCIKRSNFVGNLIFLDTIYNNFFVVFDLLNTENLLVTQNEILTHNLFFRMFTKTTKKGLYMVFKKCNMKCNIYFLTGASTLKSLEKRFQVVIDTWFFCKKKFKEADPAPPPHPGQGKL